MAETAPQVRRVWDRARRGLARVTQWMPVQGLLLFVLFVPLWRGLMEYSHLPRDAYRSSILATHFLREPGLLIATLALLAPIALCWRRTAWRTLDPSARLRVAVLAMLIVFAFTVATYDTNLFFDREWTVDRLLLLVLVALAWVHPAFAVGATLLTLVLLGQLAHPLPEADWHWPDKRLPLDALVLFTAFVWLAAVIPIRRGIYLWGLLCLLGTTYSHAAFSKLALGPSPWAWLMENDSSRLLLSAHLNGGFLAGVSDEALIATSSVLQRGRHVMNALTLAIELSPLAIFFHPKLTRWVPVALCVLHLSIVATTGIFFWKWVVVLLALSWWVWRERETVAQFGRASVIAMGAVVMVAGQWLFFNVPYAWFDTPLTNFFVLRAVGESGKRYTLPPRFFAPYDVTMTQSRFYYVLDEPVLVGTYGVTHDVEIARALGEVRPEELPELRRRLGHRFTNPWAAGRLRGFVVTSLSASNRRASRSHWLHVVAPPFHFRTTLPADAYHHQETVRAVEVSFEEWLQHDGRLLQTRALTVATWPVP